jgi:UDP-N-acetylglucosamine 1-carboxyvinyltransferase
MTAAALAHGTTVMENCATEPEVQDLAGFLNALGARVEGAGTTTITIHGVPRMHGGEYVVISDRMEAATYAVASAITGGDIIIDNIDVDHLKPVTIKLAEAGIDVQEGKHGLRVSAPKRATAVDIRTVPYPGFPTDMQQPFASLLSVAEGTSIITETIYENRFGYVNELVRMGANVSAEGRTAVIKGVEKLTGADVVATDLRAGAALLCAGLAAEGTTGLTGVQHLDRGYESVVDKLRSLGADISRSAEGESGGPRVCSL